MAENKTSNIKKLSPEERNQLVKNLSESLELLTLQADIAEARARIKKNNLEEVLYAIKITELQNPKTENPSEKNGKN